MQCKPPWLPRPWLRMLFSISFTMLIFGSTCVAVTDEVSGWNIQSSRPPALTHQLVARSLKSSEASANSQEQCIVRALSTKKLSCSSSFSATGADTVTTQDSLVKVLQECIQGNTSSTKNETKPVRLLMLKTVFSDILTNVAGLFSNITGVPVQVDAMPGPRLVPMRLASIANASNPNYTHDGWTIPQTTLGEGFAKGWFLDMTELVQLDRRIRWSSLFPGLVNTALTYKSKVVALPIGSYTAYLAYDREVFEQHNLTIPRTWRQVLEFVTKYNGTADKWGFSTTWLGCQMGSFYIRYILASYIQTHGSSQGWMFDPDTMKPLLGSAAMGEVLTIIKGLYAFSPAESATSCTNLSPMFSARRSLITIAMPNVFKYHANQANPGPLYGKLGYARWPGSEHVLDIPTNTLVPCDETRCPYAVRYTDSNGKPYLVNTAPTIEPTVMGVNGFSEPDRAFFTFQLLSYITSPEMNDRLVMDPATEAFPVRPEQLDPLRWQALGFHLEDSKGFCEQSLWSLQHPNLHCAVRMPGAIALSGLFAEASSALIQGGNSTEMILTMLSTRSAAIIDKVFGGNITAAKLEYWASINRRTDSLFVSQVPSRASSQAESSDIDQAVLVQILVPIGACIVVAAAFLAWLHKHKGGSSWGRIHHPGPGPLTTLLVTDIQDSTNIWECFEASLVDTAMKLHNACIRSLAAEHQGFESSWEGDSFIIAFPSPQLALNFALATQKALLHLAWPPALLDEVWVVAAKGPSSQAKGTLALVLGDDDAALALAPTNIPTRTDEGSSPRGLNGPPALSLKQGLDRTLSILSDEGGVDSMTEDSMPKLQVSHGNSRSTTCTGLSNQFGNTLKSQWAVCSQSTPGAVCVFRGLRVRIGLHSGVQGSDISYNNTNSRWHYTGVARVMSNAVASSGHGGFIMLSTSTASLLGQDSAGLLHNLPADCHVYHMGQHVLSGVDAPTELLLVLPAALKGRLAVQQDALRTVECLLPAVLAAPMPSADRQASLALAAVHISSLDALLSWNTSITQQAVQAALTCLHQLAREAECVISEDGWSLLLSTGKAKASAGAAFPNAVLPGRVVIAFLCAQDAVAFALELRRHMLHTEWPSELLFHELCEQVGVSDETAPNSQQFLAGRLPSASTSDRTAPATVSAGVQRQASNASTLQSVLSSVTVGSPRRGNAASTKTNPSGKQDKLSKSRYIALDSPFLRGLRTKTAVADGPTELDIAVRSSGRAVYAGAGYKQLGRMVKASKAGQIILPGHLLGDQ